MGCCCVCVSVEVVLRCRAVVVRRSFGLGWVGVWGMVGVGYIEGGYSQGGVYWIEGVCWREGGIYVLAYSSLPVFLMYFTSAFMAFVVCMMSLRLSLSLPIMVARVDLCAAYASHSKRKWVSVSVGVSSSGWRWHAWHCFMSDLPILKRKRFSGKWPLLTCTSRLA